MASNGGIVYAKKEKSVLQFDGSLDSAKKKEKRNEKKNKSQRTVEIEGTLSATEMAMLIECFVRAKR